MSQQSWVTRARSCRPAVGPLLRACRASTTLARVMRRVGVFSLGWQGRVEGCVEGVTGGVSNFRPPWLAQAVGGTRRMAPLPPHSCRSPKSPRSQLHPAQPHAPKREKPMSFGSGWRCGERGRCVRLSVGGRSAGGAIMAWAQSLAPAGNTGSPCGAQSRRTNSSLSSCTTLASGCSGCFWSQGQGEAVPAAARPAAGTRAPLPDCALYCCSHCRESLRPAPQSRPSPHPPQRAPPS
jgi:hypothetical protein